MSRPGLKGMGVPLMAIADAFIQQARRRGHPMPYGDDLVLHAIEDARDMAWFTAWRIGAMETPAQAGKGGGKLEP